MSKKILWFLELGLGIVKDWGTDEIGWELMLTELVALDGIPREQNEKHKITSSIMPVGFKESLLGSVCSVEKKYFKGKLCSFVVLLGS